MALKKKLHPHQDMRIVSAWFKQNKLPTPTAEVRLSTLRRFRWDIVVGRVAIEIQGGIHSGGAHGRGTGIMRDMAKANLAASMGYHTLFFTPKQFFTQEAVDIIRETLAV